MSLFFDGLADGINLGANLNLWNGWAGGTITAWVQRYADKVPNEQIAFFGPNAVGNTRAEIEIDGPTAKLTGYAYAPDNTTLVIGQSSAAVPLGAGSGHADSCFVAAVYDVPGDRLNVWIDGVETTTVVAFTGAAFSASVTGAGNSFGCSKNNAGLVDQFFSGLIQDFRVYKRALNREEIRCLYRMRGHDGVRGARLDLQLRYPLDSDGTSVVTVAKIRDVSAAQIVPTPAALIGVPLFDDQVLAMRRYT